VSRAQPAVYFSNPFTCKRSSTIRPTIGQTLLLW